MRLLGYELRMICLRYCRVFNEALYDAPYPNFQEVFLNNPWRCGGLMVGALDPGASAPGSIPGRGHCVVFLGKTLYSHSASLHPGV